MFGWVAGFFTYETTKSVVVKSWSVGIINRVAQLLIIIYFVGWVFIHEKAYQVRDTGIESAVMTKVKGFGFYDNSLMDVADYVMPKQGASVFCIITRMVVTPNQTQTMCAEVGLYKPVECTWTSTVVSMSSCFLFSFSLSQKSKDFNCSTDFDCEIHMSSNLPSGVWRITGKCITEVKQCEILGWCPAEDDSVKLEPMQEAENFTIFVKNSIRFPLFNVTRGNIHENNTLKCTYDPVNNSNCPIFRVADVLRYAGENFSHISKKWGKQNGCMNDTVRYVKKRDGMYVDQGGEIGINIAWICNLDQDVDNCQPSYTFTRLDSAFKNSLATQGYNFRFAKYFKRADGEDYRTLYKAYAIRFDILVSG
ncbi:hypothetical protein QTP86_032442, partial [Hemibagrus guttatus]